MLGKYRNTSEGTPLERREYIDNLYRKYENACRNGEKQEKDRIKKLLQAEGVNSYDYYSKESFCAFFLGLVGIVAVVLITLFT